MQHKAMSNDERAARKAQRAEAIRAKREAEKVQARTQILSLATRIPPHIAQGG